MEKRGEGISWYDRTTRERVGGRKELLVPFSGQIYIKYRATIVFLLL
jgi:hypothetical protein